MKKEKNLYRLLPSVDRLLENRNVAELLDNWQRSLVTAVINQCLQIARRDIGQGNITVDSIEVAIDNLPADIVATLDAWTAPSFKRVINATGIVIHTNLGRSPLPSIGLDRIKDLGGRYLNLEFDLSDGKRGQRDSGIRRFLGLLFPGYEAVVVNNNAAAILLALNTFAENKDILISRGRIIEIGDGFRINQIQAKSGARLVEVGTTNRTHLKDFEEAINDDTAMLMSVHPSNYRVIGFTADVGLADLVALGNQKEIPVIEDWGSGCIVDPLSLGVTGEESANQMLATGVDAICFSGDKMLGGPQAGIIVGKPDIVNKMRKNHLYRALRVDKLTLLMLEEVIRAYLAEKHHNIPTLEMLGRKNDVLRARAEAIAAKLDKASITVVESSARVGGGAAPEVTVPSIALQIIPEGITAEEFKEKLRDRDLPIIARIRDEHILLDLRTIFPDEDELVKQAISELIV